MKKKNSDEDKKSVEQNRRHLDIQNLWISYFKYNKTEMNNK